MTVSALRRYDTLGDRLSRLILTPALETITVSHDGKWWINDTDGGMAGRFCIRPVWSKPKENVAASVYTV